MVSREVVPFYLSLALLGGLALGLDALLHISGQVWKKASGTSPTALAAEAIAALCKLEAAALANLNAAVDAMAVRGVRVLAVATAAPSDRNWPETQSGCRSRGRGA